MSINYLESILAISESQVMALDTPQSVDNSLSNLLTDRFPIAFLDNSLMASPILSRNLTISNIKDDDADEGLGDDDSFDDDFDDDFDDEDFDDEDFDDEDFDDEDFDDSDFYEDDFDDDDLDDDFDDDVEEDADGWDDSF